MRRLVLSPRWMVWHLITLGAMVTCGWLGAWQWQRAGSNMGSALNVGYGLQWPVFAIFFGVMWWRMLQMEAARLREGEPDEPVEEPVLSHPRTDEVRIDAPRGDEQPRAVAAPRDGPSPFGPRPASVAVAAGDDDDPELAAYNRMLAELAARRPGD